MPYFSAASCVNPHGSNMLGITSRSDPASDQMRELGAEPQFQVDVGAVVEVMLEMPKVAIGRRGRTRTEQHELRAVRQRVEDRVWMRWTPVWPWRRPI